MAPLVTAPIEYGNVEAFWVEYPSGLVDLTRTQHLAASASYDVNVAVPPPLQADTQIEVAVDDSRTIRIDRAASAIVIIDMQNFFLNPQLANSPGGLKCVDPLLNAIPVLRSNGVKILWVNWGLTDPELKTIPPAQVRSFMRPGSGSFGSQLPNGFGRLLMRDQLNSQLYGPLQDAFVKGSAAGTDVWIHKNRISGMWGFQTALDLFLKASGITTLFFAGVNTDQCVSGTLVDAYFRGYDVILVEDATATTSPPGGYENVVFNARSGYGFVTDTTRLIAAGSK